MTWGEIGKKLSNEQAARDSQLAAVQAMHDRCVGPVNELVDEFVAAMKRHGNPGLEMPLERWRLPEDYPARADNHWGVGIPGSPRVNLGHAGASPVLMIHPGGAWLSGVYESGLHGYSWTFQRASVLRSFLTPSEEDYIAYAQLIQEPLASFLVKHNVPLPAD